MLIETFLGAMMQCFQTLGKENTMKYLHCCALASLIGVLCACSTVPVTGRRSLNLVSNDQLIALSDDAYDQVLAESDLSTDPQQLALVRRVGTNVAEATERYLTANGYSTEDYDWEFNVIQDETANAFAMPGGKIAVYTGILPITQTETGLAVVLSHEVAHALAGHANERYSQALLAQAGGTALSLALGQDAGVGGQLLQQTYGVGVQVGALLPFSRLQESEADVIGLTLMALAGYDPREAIPFWQRMEAAGGARPPKFLATHPDPANRVAKIQENLPEAIEIYEQNR
jgi:predicted Zn-dependent protease